ncbi:8-oxo-dGTP pyrophosphatase MutT (NUDIX family) [Microbacterium phyllosphaerae]|uniref:8-oxo-dGTP pyrophosphatase MutT (NUDIX family) n=1 Tax=Microbacterium phyllosphaerae TaxID=124798 RepID=A0ABS4WQF7_9MICO|nr:NUDIX domain-containing protein [Microbacterium phyllosphaerae]MBP2378445.1 8-oxo-dGTP pyrophosphatase MutT (NUDIX family) [Microbacterium phyllosphaerae]
MPISPYLSDLRTRVGHDLLLLPAVTAVIRRGDRFLMCRQAHSPEWGLLGGGIEPLEKPEEAVLREVREEIGVPATVHGIVGAYGGEDLHVRYPNGDRVSYTTIAFSCTIPEAMDLAYVDGELVETGWFTVDEIERLQRDRGVDRIIDDACRVPEAQSALPPDVVEKAVCYVIAEDRLLVFTHDDTDIQVTGVQVPAGTVRDDETPAQAAERELFEETGLRGTVQRSLGTELYDLSPARDERALRHFFRMDVTDPDTTAVWRAGEPDPADGGSPVSWTCRWIPLSQAHVLAGGLGARLGAATR